MTTLSLGVGIIGCGVISEIYLKRAQTFPQIDVKAVADLNPDAAHIRAEAFNVDALTVDALLARDDIDIILNLTIPAAHMDVSMAAVNAGKHVYSEKPLTGNVADARALLSLAAPNGVRVGCAPDTFLGGSHQTARALIDQGKIGTPLAGTATLMLPGHERWHPNPDFYYVRDGGGPLLDMGPYYITAMVNMLGPVSRVSGMGRSSRTTRVIESGPRKGQEIPVTTPTHITGVMEFTSGALVQITTSFDVEAHRHTPLEVYGSEGSLLVPDPNRFDGTVALYRRGEDWQDMPMTHGYGDDNYRGIGIADMADAILNNRPHRASGKLALHVLDVMESLLTATLEQRTIAIQSHCDRPDGLAPNLSVGQIHA